MYWVTVPAGSVTFTGTKASYGEKETRGLRFLQPLRVTGCSRAAATIVFHAAGRRRLMLLKRLPARGNLNHTGQHNVTRGSNVRSVLAEDWPWVGSEHWCVRPQMQVSVFNILTGRLYGNTQFSTQPPHPPMAVSVLFLPAAKHTGLGLAQRWAPSSTHAHPFARTVVQPAYLLLQRSSPR